MDNGDSTSDDYTSVIEFQSLLERKLVAEHRAMKRLEHQLREARRLVNIAQYLGAVEEEPVSAVLARQIDVLSREHTFLRVQVEQLRGGLSGLSFGPGGYRTAEIAEAITTEPQRVSGQGRGSLSSIEEDEEVLFFEPRKKSKLGKSVRRFFEWAARLEAGEMRKLPGM